MKKKWYLLLHVDVPEINCLKQPRPKKWRKKSKENNSLLDKKCIIYIFMLINIKQNNITVLWFYKRNTIKFIITFLLFLIMCCSNCIPILLTFFNFYLWFSWPFLGFYYLKHRTLIWGYMHFPILSDASHYNFLEPFYPYITFCPQDSIPKFPTKISLGTWPKNGSASEINFSLRWSGAQHVDQVCRGFVREQIKSVRRTVQRTHSKKLHLVAKCMHPCSWLQIPNMSMSLSFEILWLKKKQQTRKLV